MRVSEQLIKKYWIPVLIVAATVGSPLSATGQIVVPAKENVIDSKPAAGTAQHWLSQAREAMSQGNAPVAEHYIQIADGLYQQRSSGTELNYTPEMARQELAQLKTSAQLNFAASNDDRSSNFPAPAVNVPDMAQVDTDEAARQSLLKARQALAHGYVDTATKMCESAKQFQVDFSKLGDSPRAIETMIFHQNNLAELGRIRDKSYNERAATFLLQQAEALIGYQDFETAAVLIEQAKKFPVQFTSTTGSPDQLMQLIQTAQENTSTFDAKAEVLKLMSQAQLAVDQREWQKAKSFIDEAKQYNISDSQFAAGETRPWQLELTVQQALNIQRHESPDNGVMQTAFQEDEADNVIHADYDPATDTTRNAQVSGFEPAAVLGSPEATDAAVDREGRLARAPEYNPVPSRGMQLYRSGLQALDNSDRPRAREYFEMAWKYQDQLDSATRQAIQDQLAGLSPTMTTSTFNSENDEAFPQDVAGDIRESQKPMFRKLQEEVFKERAAAERLLETSPRQALEKMTMVRSRISQAEIDPESRRPLLTIIDRDISEMQRYIDKNLPEIINDETNAERLASVDLRRQRRYDVEQQIQKLVEEFNELVREERFADAEVVAHQARELDPESEIVALLTTKSLFLSRKAEMEQLSQMREQKTYDALRNSEESATPFDSDTPLLFGDADRFKERQEMRMARLGLGEFNSEAERTIWNQLRSQKVQGEYQGTLSSAVEQLSRQVNVNIIFDNIALAAEGVETDRSVYVPIREPISLESALNVILGTVGLVFVVEDEVIKVTSRDAQRRDVKPKTYYVGDLVTPITNFNSSMLMNFMQPTPAYNLNMNSNLLGGGSPPMMPAQQDPSLQNAAGMSMAAMAQQIPGGLAGGLPAGFGFGGYGGPPQTGTPTYNTVGPNRLGGITEADFDPLIELIRSTISPDSWDDTNGDGTIQPFVPNLSLIVSQTQEVQDQIQDLLKKLRELNDVQIVIEVRFITLQDSFFERIGIDFDFNLNDYTRGLTNPLQDEFPEPVVVGHTPTGPTANLDIEFDQDSFGGGLPAFGGFDVGTAANFGFAILSDIEVYFLIQASKGDTRSNITAAPTVTMFNGQSANVTDGSQRPFVTSVTPVVGDFAVAQQPIVTILPEGTSLNVQAVVSADRQYVRMTLVPFFSQVTSVSTFTFDGRRTTRRSSDSLLDDLLDTVNGNNNNNDDDIAEFETTTEGVTIQLPVLAQTTVNTVVSVPDGGTVLMGGVKSVSEGRNERGVPFLSNIPYVNRLFKNVGIGRDTTNRMMMVTPRIIIQEEEELIQVGDLGN